MTYVVTEACIKCKHTDCVAVCPTDAFREGPNFLVIDPQECIDCTLCVAECPVDAIYAEEDVPDDQRPFIRLNEELAPFRILTGIEVDILDDGTLDQTDELLDRLDIVVASVHSDLRAQREHMTKRMVAAVSQPWVNVLGHCTGRRVAGCSEAGPAAASAADNECGPVGFVMLSALERSVRRDPAGRSPVLRQQYTPWRSAARCRTG